MTILLLGKDGQVGWQLQRSLAPHGPVVACGRNECDLSDPAQIRSVIRQNRPSIIVNAAACTAVDKAESEPDLVHCINAEAPGILAEEAAELGALLVHYSTDYVFDGSKDAPYEETDPTGPLSVYGRSKLAGEDAIRAVDGRSLIFRTSWVFGARGGNFVKTILRLARDRDSLEVVDDQLGSPTPAALIATVTGVALAMVRYGQPGKMAKNEIYHLAAARPVSWCEFARTVVGLAGQMPDFKLRLKPEAIRPITTAEYPTPARRPANSRLDCTRLETDFGLQMPDWQPYLERMLQLLALKQNGY
ncbi:MAG: dTDP-4-dehydrorhamnose reductase [Gammaproteobacteria bacterium]|nr:dTDP-4-dehydrorhamnose reductase [Gammaproteobacteria bacterium]MBU1602159.1 dTDP-4-dehydrorhamnose reductase [Gammaproteobacteria bacterium]MBU2434206.1 dTDP-4-dehydrorhamnose reductase [Gammaproteobacteria bacterium]MBU2448470.1 dTDP-4-dehydrorhamnose reductase [Gammaproteobacteria bacterium]